jgi:hypothetical protein
MTLKWNKLAQEKLGGRLLSTINRQVPKKARLSVVVSPAADSAPCHVCTLVLAGELNARK